MAQIDGQGWGHPLTERTWLYVVLLVIVLAISGALLREPVLRPYRAMADEIAVKQRRLDEIRTESRRRLSSQADMTDIAAMYGTPLDATSRPRRATLFYRRVESMVLGSGLTIETVQPKPAQVDERGVIRFPVSVSVEGDLAGVVRLLSQVSRTTALIGVEHLSIRRRDDPKAPVAAQALLVSYGLADRETRAELAKAGRKTKRGGSDAGDPA